MFPPEKSEAKPAGDSKASPIAAVLLRMKEKGESPGTPVPVEGNVPAPEESSAAAPEGDLQIAAEEFVSASKSGDAAAVASAFKSMFDMCMAQKDMGDSE